MVDTAWVDDITRANLRTLTLAFEQGYTGREAIAWVNADVDRTMGVVEIGDKVVFLR